MDTLQNKKVSLLSNDKCMGIDIEFNDDNHEAQIEIMIMNDEDNNNNEEMKLFKTEESKLSFVKLVKSVRGLFESREIKTVYQWIPRHDYDHIIKQTDKFSKVKDVKYQDVTLCLVNIDVNNFVEGVLTSMGFSKYV